MAQLMPSTCHEFLQANGWIWCTNSRIRSMPHCQLHLCELLALHCQQVCKANQKKQDNSKICQIWHCQCSNHQNRQIQWTYRWSSRSCWGHFQDCPCSLTRTGKINGNNDGHWNHGKIKQWYHGGWCNNQCCNNSNNKQANSNAGGIPCKHYNTVHKQTKANCWELEANEHKYPAGGSSRSTNAWRQERHKATKQWVPGNVELHKITHGFPDLVITGLVVPPVETQAPIQAPNMPTQLAKAQCKWSWCLARKKLIKMAMLDSGMICHLNQPTNNLQLTDGSNKTVVMTAGEQSNTMHCTLLPMM